MLVEKSTKLVSPMLCVAISKPLADIILHVFTSKYGVWITIGMNIGIRYEVVQNQAWKL
jgi:hypothetical protein